MSLRYEICGDEAWTHTNKPFNRYWCFWGGLLAIESDLERLETELRGCVAKYGYSQEVKWNNLSDVVLPFYKELTDILFKHLHDREIRFRQAFLDRSYVHVSLPGEQPLTDLDIQFRICYQFLKHCFGLSHLPKAVGDFDKILIRLDTHSSKKHRSKLREFAEKLPILLGRTDLDIQLAHIVSHKFVRIGICDVLVGAAGSYGNRMHDRRQAGQHGMTARQRWNLEMAKYIYEKLKALNKANRGKLAFNWFESTGHDGDTKNRFLHKMRIWKFHPANHLIDKGWQNDHLDNQGRYQSPDIVTPAVMPDPFAF